MSKTAVFLLVAWAVVAMLVFVGMHFTRGAVRYRKFWYQVAFYLFSAVVALGWPVSVPIGTYLYIRYPEAGR